MSVAPNSSSPAVQRCEVRLCDRVAVARTDLLEIAVVLEHVHDPDPARVAARRDLLGDRLREPNAHARRFG
jgi:hypothetical protein